MKVLIVDDEELDLFISSKLVSLEYDVEGFTSVKAAAAWAKVNDFDVALIDFYLGPGVFANTMLSELIALKGKSFKSFVVSNYVDDAQVTALKNAGFNDIIYKPLTLEMLKKKLA
ncbi:MAG: response regulator [Chryseolinea sp.]